MTIHANTSLGQVRLKVSNLEQSITFYKDIIGFDVVRQVGAEAHIGVEEDTLIVLEEIPDAIRLPERSAAGLYHVAILLPNRASLASILYHFADKQVPIGQADHLVSEAIYLSDPDGNGLEIYRDRDRTEWNVESNGDYVMASNPIDMNQLLMEAEEGSWSGMPQGTVIGHVHMHVADLEETETYYRDVIGFETVGNYRAMHAKFMAAGRYHHHLGFNIWAGKGVPPTPENAIGMTYYTIKLVNEEEIKSLIQRLEQANRSYKQEESTLWTVDPSGMTVRFVYQR
ncbi:VOC family protein [Alkalicoccobacillus murimartini]|uniref:Catechol 2,3-dioxygenase n=1 Tax=Alkalicoccobacillus murimartini TaxID=171685 RepID=A0ABT9YIW8_9BACI|nr:VOC family protein [Alkalicoccobacillus murimartini]MDQ0207805.1 catechol 2,3-dioxygenase [Alkalicoccobacillus murimartini]